MERQLLETRGGLEGLVGRAMSQTALHRLKALYDLLTGTLGNTSAVKHPALARHHQVCVDLGIHFAAAVMRPRSASSYCLMRLSCYSHMLSLLWDHAVPSVTDLS